MGANGLPTLGINVQLIGGEKVTAEMLDVGVKGEAAGKKTEQAFALSSRAAQALEVQLNTLSQITSGWATTSDQARDIAQKMAAAIESSGRMSSASAAQVQQLADAQAVMARQTAVVTDSTRQMTLAQIRANDADVLFNGTFIESRAVLAAHAQALEMDTVAARQMALAHGAALAIDRVFDGQLIQNRTVLAAHAAALEMDSSAARSMALAHANALAMDSALSGKFVETRSVVLAHAAALEMDAKASVVASTSSGLHGLQLGRLNMELGTFIGRLTGSNTAVTRLAAMVGGSVMGYGQMIGALVAISALTWVFEKMSEGADSMAKHVADAMAKVRKEVIDTQLAMGDLQLAAATKAADVAQKNYDAASKANKSPGGFISGGAGANDAKRALDEALKDLTYWQSQKSRLDYQIQLESEKTNTSVLAELVKSGNATAAERQRALDLYRRDIAEIAALGQSQTDNVRRLSLINQAQQLKDSLSDDAFTKAQMKRLSEIEKANTAAVSSSAPSAGQQTVLDSLGKQLDEMRRVSVEGSKMVTLAQQDVTLASLQGEAHDLLANRYRAENEANAARATLSGNALSQMLADIDATKDLNDQTIILAASRAAADARRKADLADEKKATEDAQRVVDTMLKDTQRSFVAFFDSILTKGITSFSDLFSSIKNMFLKLVAEMAAADLMKKIGGSMSSVMAGMVGLPSSAGGTPGGISGETAGIGGLGSSMAKTAGEGLGMAAAGYGVGSTIGSHTTNRALGALGAAAGGAATGAAIGAMGGPIGVVAGAFIGAAAGAIGGFLGAGHSAAALAKAMEATRLSTLQNNATLADWRAQITGTAADQRAAAALDLQVKYESIRKQINDNLAGKKNEAERERELAEAAGLYTQAQKGLTDSTNALTNSMIGAINGYKYQAVIFGAAGFHAAPAMPYSGGSSGGGSSAGSGGETGDGGDTIVMLVLPDGTVLAKSVLKNLKSRAQQQFGDSTRWSDVQ